MATLTRQLAVFSHLGERGRQPIDLRQVLQDVADSFRASLPQGVEITLEAADDLPRLSGRTNEMFQLFHGVVQNAIEAMPEGGQVCISVALRRYTATASCAVAVG
jgi:C4-dicarboxylate-specific signal transduction histidine kinase